MTDETASKTFIYLDNAATSFPKPEAVHGAMDLALRTLGSAGRGAHKLALGAGRGIFDARIEAADFLGAKSERLIFTPGCTHSINYVLKGCGLSAGDTVVVSALEHNAVMRPLYQLRRTVGINIHQVRYTPGAIVEPSEFEEAIKTFKPKLCILSEASNVTGELLEVEPIAAKCLKFGIPLLIDAAQTAGRTPGALQIPGISYWAASGHKGFYGPAGVGLLYVAPDLDLEPLVLGGTGSASEDLSAPQHYPERLESGTMPLHAIAGFAAGIRCLREQGVEKKRDHEEALTIKFSEWLRDFAGAKQLGSPTPGRRLPTVSFQLEGITVDRVADLLDTEFGICVRSGLHCAASAHSTLGTLKSGAVRASFGAFNTMDDVESLISALRTIARIT